MFSKLYTVYALRLIGTPAIIQSANQQALRLMFTSKIRMRGKCELRDLRDSRISAEIFPHTTVSRVAWKRKDIQRAAAL